MSKLIGQGRTAELFEYGDNKILKIYGLSMPKDSCEKEFIITQNVYNQFNICPKAYELIESDGREGAIYERITGKTLLNNMLSNVFKINSMSRQLAHYHCSMQAPVNFKLLTVQEKLKRDIKNNSELSDGVKRHVYEYIDKLPTDNVLCHFDFHPDNIMMSDKGPVIIDWMTACVGDKLADVARTGILLRYGEMTTNSKMGISYCCCTSG